MEADVYEEFKNEIVKRKHMCAESICYSKGYTSTLVCINCGEAYHLGCLERLKAKNFDIKPYKGNLVICCNHNSDIEKSKIEVLQKENDTLNNTLKNCKDRYLHYKSLSQRMEQMVNDLKAVNSQLLVKINTPQNIDENIDNFCKMEMGFLRDLNIVLKEKNDLLVEKNQKIEQELEDFKKSEYKLSYSQVTQTKAVKTIINNKSSELIIMPIENQDSEKTEYDIKKNVDLAALKVASATIINKNKGKVIIKCKSDSDVKKIKDELSNKITSKYKVTPLINFNPRIKIVGKYNNTSLQEIEKTIINQNFSNLHGHYFKAVHIRNTKNPDSENQVLFAEVNKYTYLYIANTKKISYQFDKLRVYDDYNVLRCFKCCKYGHTSSRCQSKVDICPKCSQHHKLTECKSEVINYTNCAESNDKYKTEYSCDHFATDINCEVYKLRKKKKISMTDYENEPLL